MSALIKGILQKLSEETVKQLAEAITYKEREVFAKELSDHAKKSGASASHFNAMHQHMKAAESAPDFETAKKHITLSLHHSQKI